jgi:hypothetical protein
VQRDLDLFTSLDAHGIPLTYIGPRLVAGHNPDLARRAAADAMEGPRPGLPVSWMVAAVAAVAAALVVASLRLAPRGDG